jgi:hypothetical protein
MDTVIIKFTVNGKDQGIAFRVPKKSLEVRSTELIGNRIIFFCQVALITFIYLYFQGEALFPHILTKNQDFTVNFGQMPAPLFPLLPGKPCGGVIAVHLSIDSSSDFFLPLGSY